MEIGEIISSVMYILSILWETVKKLRDLPEEVAELRDELNFLLKVINDEDKVPEDKVPEAREVDNQPYARKESLMRLRQEAFQTEDVIDEYVIHIEEKKPEGGWAAFPSKFVYYIKTLIPQLLIAYSIQERKSVVRKKRDDFRSLYPSEPSLNSSGENQDVTLHPRLDPLETEEKVVGLAGPTDTFKVWLTEEEVRRTVISVVGIPGVGKTTLAKHVFDQFHKCFDCHALITVSRSYKDVELLRDMLHGLCKDRRKYPPAMNRVQLIDAIKKCLRGKSYLVFFDDVWNEKFWDEIKNALIDDGENKSRIIITTRDEKVADYCKRSSYVREHKLEEPLSEEECLRLLHKKARYGSDGDCPEALKDISLEIVRKCKGLPLAIVVVGGLLAEVEESALEWRRFSEDLERNPGLNIITEIIGLSYDNLPNNLRSCLLYFGMYPEDCEIESDRLIRQWIAEGFVKPIAGQAVEEVAQDLLKGLIRRSLVQVSSFSMKGKVKKCRVHDSILEMIRKKAKDTRFCEYIDGHDQSGSSDERSTSDPRFVRRLTIAINESVRSFESSLIRSIIVIPGKQEELSSDHLVSKIPTDYMPLKVLDFEDSGLSCVPKKLGKLIHLRYLSFRGTQIKSLLKSIGKLLNLETLDVRQTKVCEMPKEITKLRKLRHLLTPNSASSSIQWKDIGGMPMLQKIPQVRMEDDGVAIREVGKLKKLRSLRVLYFGGKHENCLCSSINGMTKLEALRIESVDHSEVAVDLNITPSKLRKLFLDMKLERLPNWIPELSYLERLILRHSGLTNDPLESLKKMPSLSVLSLSHAYEGQTLHFQPGGFQKLRKLHLSNLGNLNSILIDERALQSLGYFELTCLRELKTVPVGIEHLEKLMFLDLLSMPTEFEEEIAPIAERRHWSINYGHMWSEESSK